MKSFCSNLAAMLLKACRRVEGGFFWDRLNVHTFNCRHRADRGVEGGFKGWVDGCVCKN